LDVLIFTPKTGFVKTYTFSDCVRSTQITTDTVIKFKCEKIDFGNGDQGFYYEDEALIFKYNGDLWYINN
jgi:hypothetical protein